MYGQGKKQASKRISVTIPKGVDDGTRIRLAGKGEAGSRGASNGDLYLFINVYSHDLFKRSDENLFFECPISIADAALGTSIEIPTIDGGKAKIKIPSGTQSGKQFRLKGKGMPHMRGNSSGDLYLFINVYSHDLFKRSDENLFFECPISIADAALGTSIEIPTIDGGKAKIKIPSGTQSGKQFRLKGKGMPYIRGCLLYTSPSPRDRG